MRPAFTRCITASYLRRRMGRSFWGSFSIVSIFLAAWGMPQRALAIAPPTITVEAEEITHSVAQNANLLTADVNHADCLADDQITFPLVLTNREAYTLEAWVGVADCTLIAERELRTGTCSKLYSAVPQSTTSSNVFPITLHVRDILAGFSLR